MSSTKRRKLIVWGSASVITLALSVIPWLVFMRLAAGIPISEPITYIDEKTIFREVDGTLVAVLDPADIKYPDAMPEGASFFERLDAIEFPDWPRPSPEMAKLDSQISDARSRMWVNPPWSIWHPEELIPFVNLALGTSRINVLEESADRILNGTATEGDYHIIAVNFVEHEYREAAMRGEKPSFD